MPNIIFDPLVKPGVYYEQKCLAAIEKVPGAVTLCGVIRHIIDKFLCADYLYGPRDINVKNSCLNRKIWRVSALKERLLPQNFNIIFTAWSMEYRNEN